MSFRIPNYLKVADKRHIEQEKHIRDDSYLYILLRNSSHQKPKNFKSNGTKISIKIVIYVIIYYKNANKTINKATRKGE